MTTSLSFVKQLLFTLLASFLLLLTTTTASAKSNQLTGLDFQRTNQGNARVVLNFARPPQLPTTEQIAKGLRLKFFTTDVNYDLINFYDTNDFATPVSQLELFQTGAIAELIIQVEGEFSYLLTTRDNQLQIELAEKNNHNPTSYTGETVSLSYHDIPVRQLLAELAAFLNLNLIAGDSITGNITLQLDSIPSDQALDLVLISQGLASRKQGRILLVATAEELIKLEEQQQQANQSATRTGPLEDAFIKIRYANAKDLQTFILGDQKPKQPELVSMGLLLGSLPLPKTAQESTESAQNTRRFLSDRGHLLIDERTNTLYVRDTPSQVKRIKDLVKKLDVPIDQVMIEARIVVARTGVSEELGVSWGVRTTPTEGTGSFNVERNTKQGNLTNQSKLISSKGTSIDFNPITGANFGFVSGKLLLDLELAALESENRSEVISQPKVITSNRNKAVIRSGEEIPYTSVDNNDKRTTNFRQAELRLEVTPQIIGDGHIFLSLQINNDSKGEETANAGPTINTTAVETQVLVNNGETIVIGGIFTSQKLEGEVKVPFLGNLPLIGWLFRRSFTSQEKVELLVFITPRIINDNLAKN